MFIKTFQIFKLFGYKDINIHFESSIKIFIGENGFGKTTIMNALQCILTSDYLNLSRIKFDSIYIKFGNGREFHISRDDVKSYNQYMINRRESRSGILDFIKRNIDNNTQNELIKLIHSGNRSLLDQAINRYPSLNTLPRDYIINALLSIAEINNRFKVIEDLNTYIKSTGYKVLYYPTYRRIEEDFKNIINNLPLASRHTNGPDTEIFAENNSVIKFGMNDVDKRIKKMLNEISQSSISGFASVSGGMISKLLENTESKTEPHKFNIEEIKIVLSRVGENISEKDKLTILQQIEEDKTLSQQNFYLRYFLDQLLSVYKIQKQYDTAIKQFADTCNKYLSDKEFIYNESNVTLNIFRKYFSADNDTIELRQLSSGEKQIVSIFSQIYLEPHKRFIILFDEPELSLSIYWQERLLPDIIASGRCEFLMAVTHSPFIFNNSLKDYTSGINESVYE